MLESTVLQLLTNLFKDCYALDGLNHLEYNNTKRGFYLQCANQQLALQEKIQKYLYALCIVHFLVRIVCLLFHALTQSLTSRLRGCMYLLAEIHYFKK